MTVPPGRRRWPSTPSPALGRRRGNRRDRRRLDGQLDREALGLRRSGPDRLERRFDADPTLPSVSTTAFDPRLRLALDRLPEQSLTITLVARLIGSGGYAARLGVRPDGPSFDALRVTTCFAHPHPAPPAPSPPAGPGRVAPGCREGRHHHPRLPPGPSTPPSRPPGTSPPRTRPPHCGSPAVSVSPATSAPRDQRPRHRLLRRPLEGSGESVPAPPPPQNVPPTAALTWKADGRRVTADSGGSGDTDGTVVAPPGASPAPPGPAPPRPTPSPRQRSFPVTLTVTDDDGATGPSPRSSRCLGSGAAAGGGHLLPHLGLGMGHRRHRRPEWSGQLHRPAHRLRRSGPDRRERRIDPDRDALRRWGPARHRPADHPRRRQAPPTGARHHPVLPPDRHRMHLQGSPGPRPPGGSVAIDALRGPALVAARPLPPGARLRPPAPRCASASRPREHPGPPVPGPHFLWTPPAPEKGKKAGEAHPHHRRTATAQAPSASPPTLA